MAASSPNRTIDPKLVEATFHIDTAEFDEFQEDAAFFEAFRPYLERLPPKEYDLIELYYKKGKRQKDIAVLFQVSQGAISHRIARAKERLEFLRDLPKISDIVLLAKLRPHFDNVDVDIIYHMTKTTCQSKVAKIINEKYKLVGKGSMTQVKVRHKFYKAIEKIETLKEDPAYERIWLLTKKIQKNPYVLHEVILPHFDRGRSAVLGMA
jgi:predicted DNA-binding protein YlxM (UPF0122 family)